MSNALFSRLRQREQEQEAQRAAFRERTQELIRQRTTNEAVGSVGVVESMKPSSEVVNIARQRNMSVNFAHQNQSQILEAEKRQRTFEMLQNAPMLGQFLRDPNRAAAVQDSLDELAELERNLGVQITANQLLRAQGRLVSRDTQRRITNNNPAVEQHYAANLENDFSIVQGYAAQQAAQGERIFSGEATEDFKGAIGAFFAGTLPLAFKSLGETGRVGAEFAAERIEAGPDWMQDAILWQQIPIKAAQFALKQSPIYQTDIGRQILDYELPTASEYFRTQEAIFGELEQAGEAAMEFLEPEELNFAQKVTGALGQIATQVVVSSLNPATGAAMMTSQGASQQISRMEAQGIDASSKPLAIIAGGATTYILENLRLNSIFKAMPSELKGAAAKGFFSSLRRVGVQAGQEAVQEATETVIQNVIALFAYDSDAKIFEGAGEGAAVGGTAAAIFQTFVELALPRRARTNLTEQEAQQLSEAHQIVSAAAATKSNKDAVEEFINNANETQTVDIDAEGFQELYQSDPEGTRTMLQALGVSEEQMVEAMSGNSITLPAAKLMTMEDKGQFDQILDITRTSEGGMTPQEARREIEEGLGPELTEKLQQITEENIEQQRDETIARDVQTQLIAAGRSKQEAKAAGKIWSSAFASLEAMGVDSKAIYEKLELRINDTTEIEQAASLLPQAQEEGYEGQDTGEAREWIRARNKGLDMSSEARMQRARDMGFDTDTVLYHGTGRLGNFEEGFDPALSGQGNDQYGSGFYFTTDPAEASMYAGGQAGQGSAGVIPAYNKINNPLVIDRNKQASLRDSNASFTEEQVYQIMKRNPDIYDLEKSPIGDWVDIYSEGQVTDKMLRDVAKNYAGPGQLQMIEGDLFRNNSGAFRRAVNEVTGIDGVIVKFDDREHRIAWFPEQIRSVNAAFDLDYADTPALLAQETNEAEEQLEADLEQATVSDALKDVFVRRDPHKVGDAVIKYFESVGIETFNVSRSVNRNQQKSFYFDVDGFPERIRISDHAANQDFRVNELHLADALSTQTINNIAKIAMQLKPLDFKNPELQSALKESNKKLRDAGERGYAYIYSITEGTVEFNPAIEKFVRPTLLAQTSADLQQTPVRIDGTGSGGRVLNWDFAKFLTDRHMDTYGRVLDPSDPDDYDTILQSLLQDYEEQTAQEDTGDAWYTDDINEAIELTSQIYPELNKPEFRDLFLTVTALLSPRQKPAANWENAILALRSWAETGRLELAKPNGKQFGVEAQRTSLELFQYMIDTMGLEEATKWVQSKHTGREMAEIRMQSGIYRKDAPSDKAKDYLPSETNLTEAKLGIYMFGPKVGDFMQNSVGIDQSAVTVDLWAARTYNRYIGRLMDVAPKLAEAKQIQSDVRGRAERQNITKLFREAAQQVGIDPSAMQAALWYFEQRLYRVHGIKSDSQNFSDAARKSLTQRGIDVFTGRDQQAESRDVGTGATVVSQKEDGVGSERAGDGGRRLPSGRFARLEGSPTVRAATGPIPRIVEVADKYARDNGIPAGRQAQYARVDEERAERIAQAYEEMEHNPSDPAVQAAYNDLVRQTIAQYEALLEAGYQFYFIDINSDVGLEYVESLFNAMRELRADQRMGVFPTDEGFGTLDADVDDNPLLATTKYQWPFGSPDGELRPVTANDLFRAVHDALGHGLEGAGFRARGEENAWQAHVRLYTGAAVGAMTSETRGQNSWLNYGPYGETNRTAKTEDTVFADQKTGLMPEWTWTEGRVPDMQPDPRSLFAQEGGTTRGTTRIMGELGSGSVLGTSPTIVKLLEAANQTTFLHESAHVFLEIYAALEQENEQVAEMMVPLREWLGWEVGQPLTVEMHEKFAGREEGFELYIKTGKAPSTALEKAFEAFRKWFNQIYQSVRGMANNLDPRAREFFDRMLATEEEIAEAQMKFHDSMTETVRDFMSPEQREKHRELQALAKKVATDKLFRKHLEQMQKSEKKQYKKDKEKISEQVRAEVSESPVFKAMSALADTESPVKLNRQATLDILGDERIVPVEPYLSEEGIDPELFAASFGYDTADQMFAEIAEDPDYDEIVEIEARRRMDDLQSDLLINQESAQAEAIEASFNDAQVRKLKVELDAIAEKALKETIPLAAIRKRARDIIDTKPLNEIIKPGKYALQAMNLHKKAIKAAATQKWDDAFRLTQQAMLQHHLARYAFQARTEVEKGNRFLARFALHRKLDPKKIAPEFIQRIRAMMELPTASPERQAQIRQDLQMFEEQQAENNFPVALPSQVYADQDMTERRSMTLEQFREFRDSIRNLNKGGRLQSEQAKAISTKISTEAADAIFASWGKRNLKGYSRSKKFGENIGSFLRQGDAAIIRLPYLAAWLQGRKDKQPIGMVRGVIVDTLYNDLSVAVNAKEKRLAALDEALLAIFKKHKISKNEIHAKVNVPEIETGGQITKNELFSLLLNMGTASNKQRVTDDVTLQGDAEQLLRMLENRLDKKYFDAAQDIWDLINTQRNDLGAVHLRRTGVTPTWVEAEQLVTKYGTYAGGYYPLKYDPKADANRDLNERKQEDVFKQNSHGIAAKAQTKSGMLKERLTNVKRPLYLNIDALIEHFAETATFIEMSEPIDAAWNLANSRQFGEALSQTWGSEYIEAVKTILRRSAADAVESGELGSKWLDKMLKSTRINASIAILGLNLPTAALAPVSIFQTVIPRYGIKVFARGMVEFAKRGVSFAIDSANTMEKKSPFMRERTRLINREAHDIAKRKISEGVWNKAQAAGFVPMVQIEKYTVSGPLWWGVYKTSLMDGLSEQQAIAAADTAVGTTQGSGRVIDLSVMQSSTSELSKATLTFMYGYVSGYYGVVRTDVALAETNIAKTMQIVKHLMVLNVLASTIETLIRQGLWEDDEEDAFLLAILSRMGRNSVLVPALSNFLSRYSSTTALEDVVKKGRQSAEYGWKSYDFESGEIDGEKAQKAAMKALQAFGFAAGVPGMTQMDRVISVYEEDDDPTLPEYLITGPDDDN
tara:strand:+ start:8213 stop:17179 length:8967 start_codon:yes stop_codon:yes gene_type:complete